MKKRVSLGVLLLAFLGYALSGKAQIVTEYSMGFEATGESYGYTIVSGTVAPTTEFYSSGSRSIKLSHTSQQAIIMTDTIDLSRNSAYDQFYLEFMHINNTSPQQFNYATDACIVQMKRVGESDWYTLNGTQDYDMTWGGGSSDFASNPSFSRMSYDAWQGTINNNSWRKERFVLNNRVRAASSVSDRKIQIRFIVKEYNGSGTPGTGWFIDNITVKCSQWAMTSPTCTMLSYPENGAYPSSRAARIDAQIQTPVTDGLDADSIYVVYKVGHENVLHRVTMTRITGTNAGGKYRAYIPFNGYDTLVSWRLVARDASLNHNTVNFPTDETAWSTFWFVRGNELPLQWNPPTSAGSLPFTSNGAQKSQFIYPRETLQQMGYTAGAVTQLRYAVASNANNSSRDRVRIQMTNIDNSGNTINLADGTLPFYSEFQKTVYDSSLVVNQNANTQGVINLQDTFFYSGEDILITFTSQNNSSDPRAFNIRQMAAGGNSVTISQGFAQNLGLGAFTSDMFNSGVYSNERPYIVMRQMGNLPLIYDCGVSGFITPNDTTPANATSGSAVTIALKNYGAQPMNGVRIYYQIDNSPAQYYDWTGTLAAGATANVTLNNSQSYTIGYHEIRAWVDDSITCGGVKNRDHEPLNDTMWTRFIACAGPMSGTVNVGGAGATYNTLNNFLYAVSQCGVNGPLTVKLASGTYSPETWPLIPGASATNIITFEPQSATGMPVIFTTTTGVATSQQIVNLQSTKHVRFNRIVFRSNSQAAATYLVRLGVNSSGCQFTNCSFEEVAGGTPSLMTSSALLYSGGADSLYVSGCSFNRGTTGVSLVGPAQDNMARGSIIEKNTFTNQGTNSIIVRNQMGTVVDSNTMNGVYANSSYAILLQDVQGGVRVTRNTVLVTSGASGIGATGVAGTATNYAVIANNNIVSMDEGTSNLLTTPLNIITANYTKVVYNSVKLVAPSRTGIAAATFGGGTLRNSQFFNNIVYCGDNANFAFSYIPTTGGNNTIGNNIYYSNGPLLNKYNGLNCTSMSSWTTQMPSDGQSQNVDPAFLGSTVTDLRTYSQSVRGHGVTIAEVTNDLYGTIRGATPCVGAFEFSSLPYDFEVVDMLSPESDYCDGTTSARIEVVIQNSGVSAYDPTTQNLTLTYSRTNRAGVMTSGQSGNITVNRAIPANDTIHFSSTAALYFPVNGQEDTTYQYYFWLTSTIDPNPANDTSSFTVSSHYHYPAPSSIIDSINYGEQDTIHVRNGVQTWYTNIYRSGRADSSTVYWYTSPTATTPFHIGNSYTTGVLYNDTTLYIGQRRDLGLLKISEVQLKSNGEGLTYPMPTWMTAFFAVELMNVGDAPVDITGDTLQLVSPSSAYNRTYVFPHMVVQPGATLVVQWRAGINSVDSSKTVATPNVTINNNNGQNFTAVNFGVVYRDGRGVADGVAFNAITTQTVWTNQRVPAAVWSGNGITLDNTTAGVYRKSWPTNGSATPSNSQSYWQVADASHLMTMGTSNENLVLYTDNGCKEDVAPVNIYIRTQPSVDLEMDSLSLPTGCGVGVEQVRMTVWNHGADTSDIVVAKLVVNNALVCTDTLTRIAPHRSITHTFTQAVNMISPRDERIFNVEVFVDHQTNDAAAFNDTTRFTVHSYYTPGAPMVMMYDTVQYGMRDTLTTIVRTNDSLVWFDRNMRLLDTTNVYVTNYLYLNDTFYVAALGRADRPFHVGTLATLSNATAYPSPMNPNRKYVKEQYLFTAAQMRAAGHGAGEINSISFYLDTIWGAGQMTYDYYTIGIGTTTSSVFTSNNAWVAVSQVYTDSNFTVRNSDKGWYKFVFQTPYQWDGTSNLVVQITSAQNAVVTQGSRIYYTNGGANTVLFKNDNNTDMSTYTANGARSANRPDIQFGFMEPNCMGPMSPIYVAVNGTPSTDLSIAWPEGWDTISFSSCGNNPLNVQVENNGTSAVDNYTIDYWIDNQHGSYTGTTTVTPREPQQLTIATPSLTPGRHRLTIAITNTNDTIQTNDTISSIINVKFCAGTYTIGTTGNYPNFRTAIDTLNNAGVDGAVVFSVQSGTYNEQVSIGSITGVSATNTVTFTAATGNASDVILRGQPTQANNYVLNIDGAEYVTIGSITVYGFGTGNYSNAVTVSNSQHINFDNAILRVKGTLNNIEGSCLVLGENVGDLHIANSLLDSGYFSVRSKVSTMGGSNGVIIERSTLQNFWYMGVYLRKVDDVYVRNNKIKSGVGINSRALTGVYVAEHTGALTVEANEIVLYDQRNGGKQGIHLSRVIADNVLRSSIVNNMTACYGIGVGGQVSYGIIIDSSEFANVLYNTCNVYAGTNVAQSCAFTTRHNSQGLVVMNNIFTNASRGYAYYAELPANIATSNYNNYWSNSLETNPRLVYWGREVPTLDSLRSINNQDQNSVNMPAYYISDENLRLSVGDFCERAQYNTSVPRDIDDTIRPQIPSPTMGCHEYQRCTHNIAITDIIEPKLDITENIETDTLRVIVRLYNDGTSIETNLQWWAEVDGTGAVQCVSDRKTISEMQPQSEIYDTVYIAMPVGIIDTHNIVIHFPMAMVDCEPTNNEKSQAFYLKSAFNFAATRVEWVNDGNNNCRLNNTQMSITLTNVGEKTIGTEVPVTIGLQAYLNTSGLTVSTLPIAWTEQQTLPEPVERNASVTLTFNHPFNFYPTGNAKDIVVRCRGSVSYAHDQKPANDTTPYINVTSKYTPSAPVGTDLRIPYATWDTIHAYHTDVPPTGAEIHRPIRWHRDSLAEPFYSPTNYNQSTWWETPQYFHDSVYYLACISTSSCTSYYRPVHVYLNPRVANDAAVVSVVEPQDTMVYMQKDSVKVGIINYGSGAITNIPVYYQLFTPNGVLLQEVREVCHATIQPDSVYVYKFDSLITIPAWDQKYKIRTWTDLSNEQVRLNDTLRGYYEFYAANDNTYKTSRVVNAPGMDITRVAYSSLDNTVNEAGYRYIDFASFANPAVAPLHLIKGTTDTMIIEVANSSDRSDYESMGFLSVYIDYNRDGFFDRGDGYAYTNTELIFADTCHSRIPKKFVYTIPTESRLGYMRMRVIVEQNGDSSHVGQPIGTDSANFDFGCIHDYLLYVEDVPVDYDIAVSRISSPRSHILTTMENTISFMLTNKGRLPVSSTTIDYAYADGHPMDPTGRGSFTWTGDLQPGQSVEVSLDPRTFHKGTTLMKICATTPGDTLSWNDTLWYEYFIFDTIELIFSDDFEGENRWYAPRGYNDWDANWFQRGVPRKPNIMTALSDSSVWATNLTGYVIPSGKGNVSYLYTPVVNISQIRPDTIDFWLSTAMADGHRMVLEYFDYTSHWKTVGTANDTMWYNEGEGWMGNSSGYVYQHYLFPLSHISGEFQQYVQFRFVYTIDPGAPACDGVAIDNFTIGRAQRAIDVGIIAITHPTRPQFGQTIYPRVVIKNFGYDTVYSATLAYRPYGSNLAKTGTFNSTTGLAPGESTLFTFSDPFIVRNNFPDTFEICAYTTVNMDIYWENDSTCKDFYLNPLDNDLAMVGFITPLDRIVAGDSITVTTRIRNYGQAPVSTVDLTYVYNRNTVVTETVNIEDLIGHELQSFEYLNYTFRRKVRSSMGQMNITAYVSMANDDYLFNDTITKTVQGISAITDLSAREVIVDTSNFNQYRFQLTIDNVGARGVSDFEVGFWYYNDTSTLIRETVHLDQPLAALSSYHHMFDTVLQQHNEYYRYITAYVHAAEDNDRSNDTTTQIGRRLVSMLPVEILVEETREEQCRVRFAITNNGNLNSSRLRPIKMSANINGTTIRRNNMYAVVEPGDTIHLTFEQTIPKSPTRTYVGSGSFFSTDDYDTSDNQTTIIRVVNHFEGITPVVTESGLSLEQNYPNPFESKTSISFHLPSAGEVRFFVMDELGRVVYQEKKTYPEGDNAIDFDGKDMSSGVYIYGIEWNGERLMRKMTYKN